MRSMLPLLAVLAGCGPTLGQPVLGDDLAEPATAASWSVSAPGEAVPLDKAAPCAATFGNALTNAFGRFDGVITAVVTPADGQCPMPNGDHLVVQARMNGAIYRLVVNVQSSGADPKVRVSTIAHALTAGAWSEGWHENASLDYPADLGVHANQNGFAPRAMAELVPALRDALRLGAKISVFATSSGGSYAHSAHLVHRTGNHTDGALVIDPTGASPSWWLFHFPDQSF